MKKYLFPFVFFFVVISGNDCFSQVNGSPKRGLLFNRSFMVFQHGMKKQKTLCTFPDNSGSVSEQKETFYPLIIAVSLNQKTSNMFEKEKQIFHGPDLLTPCELRQILCDIFNKFEANNKVIQINIVSMDKNGYIEVIALAEKTEIDLSKPLPEPASMYLPYERYHEFYPENAFDENGNLSYWSYYSHTNCGFANATSGSMSAHLEKRTSYTNNGKEQFIEDLVNYTLTWIEQDDRKDYPPLYPRGAQELKK